MWIQRLSITAILALAMVSSTAHAIQPVIRMSSTCSVPTMPSRGSAQGDWDTYSLLVRDYDECASSKVAGYGQKTKDALEGVGKRVTDWGDTAKGWFDN